MTCGQRGQGFRSLRRLIRLKDLLFVPSQTASIVFWRCPADGETSKNVAVIVISDPFVVQRCMAGRVSENREGRIE